MLASTIKVSVVHLLSLLTKQRCHFRGKTESVNGIRSLRHKGLILAFNTLYNTLLLNQLMGTLQPSHKQGDCKAKKARPSVGNPRKCEKREKICRALNPKPVQIEICLLFFLIFIDGRVVDLRQSISCRGLY